MEGERSSSAGQRRVVNNGGKKWTGGARIIRRVFRKFCKPCSTTPREDCEGEEVPYMGVKRGRQRTVEVEESSSYGVQENGRKNQVKNSTLKREDTEYGIACQALARRLGEELRSAKSAQLACGEVLLPVNLLPRVANQILAASEKEPCGLRGCTLDISLETEDGGGRPISSIVWDPSTSSTFQLTLTFRQDSQRKWHSRFSQFLKTLTKGRTIIISSDFSLEKIRLYRSLSC